MSYPSDESNPNWSENEDREPRDSAILTSLAWIVIIAAVSLIVIARQLAPEKDEASGSLDRSQLIVQEMMGRYIIGAKEFLRISGEEGPQIDTILKTFPAQSAGEKMCLAVLKGEINGPEAALEELSETVTGSDEEARLHRILSSLYRDYLEGDRRGSSVSREDRQFLEETLGWFGDLALSPPPPPMNHERLALGIGGPTALKAGARVNEGRRDEVMRLGLQTVGALLSGLGSVCFLGFIGLIGLVLLILNASRGKLQEGMGDPIRYGGIYAETFALWMLLFGGFTVVYPMLFPVLDLLESTALGMASSLVALAWPVRRGVPWLRVREDIGWTQGTRPGVEPMMGIVCYVLTVPLLGLGLVLLALFSQMPGVGALAANDAPSHPIIEYLIRDDPWTRFKVVFLACVIAPVVEETMFRGVFYRHVREKTRDFGGAWSFAVSAFLVSFVFAVIHPQGWLTVPLLMGIAVGLTIGREWRGTLLPSMVAHGIHNGLVLTMAIQMLGN